VEGDFYFKAIPFPGREPRYVEEFSFLEDYLLEDVQERFLHLNKIAMGLTVTDGIERYYTLQR
jgi:hypothetical protein